MKDIDELIKEVNEIPGQLKSGEMDLERAELLITAKSTILETYELSLVTQGSGETDDSLCKKQIKRARKVIAKVENEIEKLRKEHDKQD
ncbi:MAG: hypothetical protein ACYS3N_18145 [Planctomycetota bacterium]|jgi:hypothetical protein